LDHEHPAKPANAAKVAGKAVRGIDLRDEIMKEL
jgi:hypothetical protein